MFQNIQIEIYHVEHTIEVEYVIVLSVHIISTKLLTYCLTEYTAGKCTYCICVMLCMGNQCSAYHVLYVYAMSCM